MTLKEIKSCISMKNKKENLKMLDSDIKVGWSIYQARSLGEGLKRFHILHFLFKYKFLVPVLLIIEKTIGKYLSKSVPDYWYNKELKIFDKSFEKSIKEWLIIYCKNTKKTIPEKNISFTKEKVEELYKNKLSCRMLRVIKNLSLTYAINDTAYRTFFTIFMHNLANDMINEYKGQVVNEIVYNQKNVFDVRYYVIGREIKGLKWELKRAEGYEEEPK